MPTIEIIPDIRQIIIQMISLIFLFFMFKRYGWNPTKAFLAKRQELIASQFEAAQSAERDALALKDEYEQHIATMETEGQQLIANHIEQGKIAYEGILADARHLAEERLAHVQATMAQDRKMAYDQLKTEIIDLTIDGASQIIKKEINPDVHEQLFADFIAKVGGLDEQQ